MPREFEANLDLRLFSPSLSPPSPNSYIPTLQQFPASCHTVPHNCPLVLPPSEGTSGCWRSGRMLRMLTFWASVSSSWASTVQLLAPLPPSFRTKLLARWVESSFLGTGYQLVTKGQYHGSFYLWHEAGERAFFLKATTDMNTMPIDSLELKLFWWCNGPTSISKEFQLREMRLQTSVTDLSSARLTDPRCTSLSAKHENKNKITKYVHISYILK